MTAMATKIVISDLPPYFLDLEAPKLGAREVEPLIDFGGWATPA